MRPKILCTLALPQPFDGMVGTVADVTTLGVIPAPDRLREELRRAPVDVLCPQMDDVIDDRLLDAAGSGLRAICIYAAGYNNIDVDAATSRNIIVANTPGPLTDATADCAMGLLIGCARRLLEGDAAVRRGDFAGWAPDYLLGRDVTGATLGIIGFGRIGQAVARRALGFSMRVVYAQRASAVIADDLQGRVTAVRHDELLETSDFVSLHVPLTADTRHLIDESALHRMKPDAILINTARGPVVDEAALVRALQERWIAGAGLDVYEFEPELSPGLAHCENAVLAPHIGSATQRTRAAMAQLCATNALDALAARIPGNCLNRAAWAGGAPVPLTPPEDQ